MLRTVYTALLYGLAPALLIWLYRASRQRGGNRFWRERRGRYLPDSAGAASPLWVHCASVGEVRTAAPLIHVLGEQRPDLPLLVTTATATGADTAARVLPAGVLHAYQPLDWPGAVGRFLDRFRPQIGVILETEIWPNLYAAAQQRGVPLLLTNARMSQRTLNGPALIRRLQSRALARVDRVLARSVPDARRFSAFGVCDQRLEVVGSLKLAPPHRPTPEPFAFGRPAIVAASTHDDEEVRIAQAWDGARQESVVPQLLTIVPRHPERGVAVRDSLRHAGFRTALRSAGDDWRDYEIYVVDTLGELESFMAGAELVIIGGSLIPRGGQNLVEPARLGRPILFGPHMSNFAEESERLLNAGGAQRFLDDADLQHAIGELARDRQAREELGRRAAATVAAAQDTAETYAKAILERLPRAAEPGDNR